MDRLEGKDANNILQCYTDMLPGPARPSVEHRAPGGRPAAALRPRRRAEPVTKLNALTIMAGEHQTHDYYMTIGPMFADPLARQLYAEIASIEEQHVTQYESIIDPRETWLEKWLLHEATEVYNYWSCVEFERQPAHQGDLGALPRLRARPAAVRAQSCSRTPRGADAAEVLPARLPEPIQYTSQREFVREVLEREVDLRAMGPEFVPEDELPAQQPVPRLRQADEQGRAAPRRRWPPGGSGRRAPS